MKRWATAATFVLVLLTRIAGASEPETVRDVEVRPGVTQRVLIHRADPAAPVLVLLPGGDGHVFITADGVVAEDDNFLIRARRRFWPRGLTTVVVDAPTDHQDNAGLSQARTTDWHAQDISQIAKAVGGGAPVWVVGNSLGAVSAANALVHDDGAFAGGILSSTPTMPSKNRGVTVFDVDLATIKHRVLLLYHDADACAESPPEMLDRLAFELKNARVDRAVVTGGTNPGANPCRALSHHGFYGAEKEAVDAIVDFVTR